MADSNAPKYTLQRTGKTVANAIEKALESAKKSDTATTVITSLNGTAVAASVEGEVLNLTAITPTTTDIHEAVDNDASVDNPSDAQNEYE